eukprot:CAMPEP_0115856530 /NCGR_PEP_ID=MMETSP0287-20121206/15104_1 /TAXON_ID=412157 /ORGANISM="Chrysochromulina rotalis, Strain UIO044" /LENGTH=164 /DNA_ID=CAMNT_0003310715 /DNA_START=699 /DNA_END=1193 /DNA_ORIENTATION=+
MPSEGMPPILRALRLAITTTIAPSTSSSFMWWARPERIWRGFSSPRSIVSMYSLSESGWLFASTILPTRRSAQLTDTPEPSGGGGGAALGSFFSFSFLAFFSVDGASEGAAPPPPPAALAPLAGAGASASADDAALVGTATPPPPGEPTSTGSEATVGGGEGVL